MSQRQPLAVVGYAYRAPNVGRKGLFEFLEQGKSAWSRVPADRFNHDAYYHPDSERAGFISSHGGHFMPDDLYAFDPAFFNIKAEEARSMDPQHRLLLECAFEAAESAGILLNDLMGANIGVFAASDKSEYYNSAAQDLPTASIFTATGVNPCMFANRLSYFFGLTGPSIAVDAACASSCSAIHQACQAILAGDCSAAFVAGAKTLNGPNQWIELDTMGTLSSEGKCFSYDSRASGFGRGEGAACIIIRPLSDALASGDPVRAVIRNSAGNHSGRTQGISMPGRASQEKLLSRLHQDIGLDPNETAFVEGHGTGTQVGHLENASGLLSVIKCIMMLEHDIMLPNANFQEFNSDIEGRDRLKVLTESAPWPSDATRRVCISNFGFGGSNAALLLEAAPKSSTPNGNGILHQSNGSHHNNANGAFGLVEYTKNKLGWNGNGSKFPATRFQGVINGHDDAEIVERLFPFSARSQVSLDAYIISFRDYLNTASSSISNFNDLAFTLGQRRTHFQHRNAVSASSIDELKQKLQTFPPSAKSVLAKDQTLAFVFTGQGAQYFQMGNSLRGYPKFEESMSAAEQLLKQLGATWSLTDELNKGEHESRIDDAEISQPACTAIQLALVNLLRHWGIMPAAVVGHSSGEIAAAYAADILTFETALAIAYFRGIAAAKILRETSGVQGAMLAIGANAEQAEKLFPNDESYAVIAAVNSYGSVTISGDLTAIEYIQEKAQDLGLFVRRLKTGLAYHSRHMERVAASYSASIEPFCCLNSDVSQASQNPVFVSSVTGRIESPAAIDTQYWAQNLLQPVQYLTAVETLFSDYHDNKSGDVLPSILIEIGPHSALQNPSKEILERLLSNDTGKSPSQVTYMPSLVRGKNATTAILDLTAKLYSRGVSVKFEEVNQTEPSRVCVVHDLPPYEWNKAVRYIHQPRVAKQKLFGGKAYNALLGWESPYKEGDEQVYRNIFSLDDLPWMRDHVVDGQILFPFTGFVSIAIEAFKSLNDTASGVILRELHVSTSLEIDEDKPADITTKFRPAATGTGSFSKLVWNFEIMSWTEVHGWKRHSHGFIEEENSRDPFSRSPTVQAALRALENQELQKLDVDSQYALLRENNGIAYGKTFRNTIDFWQASELVVHTMALRKIDLEAYGSPSKSPFTVDPPTLDTIFHSLGAIQEICGPRPILVPSFCSQWRIASDIPASAGQEFTIVSRRLKFDEKASRMQMNFVVFDTSGLSPKPVAEIGPLTLQCISRPEATNLRLPDTFSFKNVPYVNLMDPNVISKTLEGTPPPESEISHRHDLDQAAIIFLSRALEAEYDLSNLPSHFPNFLVWAKDALAGNPSSTPEADVQALIDRISTSNATGELVCAIGEQLPAILRGEKQALEIMLEDGLLWRTYAENVAGIRANQALADYVALLSANNAELNIIELGAGTASATLPILDGICRATKGAATNFSYEFTDISAGFFDKAQAKLSQWSEHITYKKLDISHDPLTQGFKAESYDVVLASNVLHATSDIVSTLSNVRSLLKPGGKILLMEGVNRPPPSFLPYALLPGWWLFEDSYRTDGPLLTKELWNSALLANGFSGLEGHVDDYPGQPEGLFSALWSSRSDQEERIQACDGPITIYQCSSDEESLSFAKTISSRLKSQFSTTPTTRDLSDIDRKDDDQLCVILDSQQRSIFSNMTSENFYAVKNILIRSSRLIWVLPDKAHPDASMIRGLLRTIRLELPFSKLILFEAPLDGEAAKSIGKLADHIMRDPHSLVQSEQEYTLIDGTICVPRLQLVGAAKEIFAMEAGGLIKSEQKIWQKDTALEVSVDFAGSLDSLYFRRSNILETDLGDEEVIVRVKAAGINFIDLVTVLGTLPWSPPGLEGAGIVERIGSRVNDLQIGDRVFYAIDKAGMANFVRMPVTCAHKIPDNLDFAEAASLPIAYSTAIMSLLDVGRLQKGESVLIHSASGAVGQACISIAQNVGAQIFATAGTPEKREFLTEKYGIPSNQIFTSRTPEFKDGIMKATESQGVDMVVNCLSEQLLQYTWDLIAENGRFIEIGKKDLLDNSYLPMGNFIKNVTFSGVDVRRIISTQPARVNKWLSTITRMFQEGKIAPIHPISKIAASEVKMGLRKLQTGQNIGKIVVVMGHDDRVLAESCSPMKRDSSTSTLLRHDATYLIAGGTGGIGRALVPWMIGRGAKNVVILGCSASTNPKVQEILKQYEGTDVCVRAIPCDAGSRTDMIRASQAISDLPRVRGVVHSAICLSDSIFANLEYNEYQQTTGSRVQGAWLLHELYPDLEFFVALSGMTGIVGNSGQSVYTGTSTFLEAFVDHRLALGLPGAVIHLPPVEDIGLVAELNIGERLRSSIGGILSAQEVYTLVEGAILGPSAGLGVGGKNLSWSLVPSTEVEMLPWERFMPISVMKRQRIGRNGLNHSQSGKENRLQLLKSASLDGLMDALMDKVSSMTAMDKDEVTPTRSLIDYGLDSLISLELRNWIRRNFDVHMETSDINTSTDLRAIADYILSHKKTVS
ncbi:hypothetical protein TruAng_004389 [Truncatella angustata]|nr:hypothetical protein TruAng_004389 [Truncatella angustata]